MCGSRVRWLGPLVAVSLIGAACSGTANSAGPEPDTSTVGDEFVLSAPTTAEAVSDPMTGGSQTAGTGEEGADDVDFTQPLSDVAPSGRDVVAELGRPVRILVVGDSVPWTATLGWDADPAQVDVLLSTMIGCGVIIGTIYVRGRLQQQPPLCRLWEPYWVESVSLHHPDISVFMIGAWEVHDYWIDGAVVEAGGDAHRELVEQGFERTVEILSAEGAPVVIATSPCFPVPDEYLVQELDVGLSLREYERVIYVNSIAREVASRHDNVTVVELGEYLCPGGQPVPLVNGVDVRPDGEHYSEDGADEVWNWLLPRVFDQVTTAG